MATHETELFKDKIEVSLDGRQIFYLFFGGAVIATLVFVLGVMVGRRVEARAMVETGSPATDPLAALDRLEAGGELAFPSALRGDEVTLGSVDESLVRRKSDKPGVGGPLLSEDEVKAAQETAARARAEKAAAEKRAREKKGAAETQASEKSAEADESEQAKADSEPAAEEKAAKRRRFTLQVGSFQDKGEADDFFRQLKEASYDPYMVQADVPGKGQYFRVRVGAFASFEKALAAKKAFEDSQHVIAYVTRVK